MLDLATKKDSRQYKQKLLSRLENIICKIEDTEQKYLYMQDVQYAIKYLRRMIDGNQSDFNNWVLEYHVFTRHRLLVKWYYMSMSLDI